MAAKKLPQIPGYSNYQRLPSMVLGFHGCDASVGEAVLKGKVPHLATSANEYDWLGGGIYFWENDPRRAMEWAIAGMNNPGITKGKITKPFVVGAVIELGHCLNLMSRHCIEELKVAHQLLVSASKAAGVPLPEDADKEVPAYDTVRAAFREGEPAYEGAGFEEKNHIQIAVRDKARIKGYFRPICD